MTETNPKTPADALRRLAAVLNDEECDPDDLIHAFGDIEAMRTEVAQLLTTLLERESD